MSLFISLYIFGFLFVVWRWFFFTSKIYMSKEAEYQKKNLKASFFYGRGQGTKMHVKVDLIHLVHLGMFYRRPKFGYRMMKQFGLVASCLKMLRRMHWKYFWKMAECVSLLVSRIFFTDTICIIYWPLFHLENLWTNVSFWKL